MSSYKKLVRDKIPDIIRENGDEPIIRILDDVEYKKELEKKLQEECLEVINTTNSDDRIEELADVLEVVIALANVEGKSLDDVLTIADMKKQKRGIFSKRIYLDGVK